MSLGAPGACCELCLARCKNVQCSCRYLHLSQLSSFPLKPRRVVNSSCHDRAVKKRFKNAFFFSFDSEGIQRASSGVSMALQLPSFDQTNPSLIQVSFAECVAIPSRIYLKYGKHESICSFFSFKLLSPSLSSASNLILLGFNLLD